MSPIIFSGVVMTLSPLWLQCLLRRRLRRLWSFSQKTCTLKMWFLTKTVKELPYDLVVFFQAFSLSKVAQDASGTITMSSIIFPGVVMTISLLWLQCPLRRRLWWLWSFSPKIASYKWDFYQNTKGITLGFGRLFSTIFPLRKASNRHEEPSQCPQYFFWK